MSALLPNFSKFYYGFKITAEPYNGYIDLDEGDGEISVQVSVGSYTLDELAVAINQALATQATLDYSVTVNRSTRRLTISADADFDILVDSGSHSGNGIYSLIGLPTTADLTGADEYASTGAAGSVYYPQWLLQSFVSPEDWREANQGVVNVSASASVVETVNFGLAQFTQFDIDYITNKRMDGVVIKNNPTGLEDAREFLRFITEKNYFEFIPNENDPDTYYKVLCESTGDYTDGTGYKLKERYDENLPGVFKTGIIKLRVL